MKLNEIKDYAVIDNGLGEYVVSIKKEHLPKKAYDLTLIVKDFEFKFETNILDSDYMLTLVSTTLGTADQIAEGELV